MIIPSVISKRTLVLKSTLLSLASLLVLLLGTSKVQAQFTYGSNASDLGSGCYRLTQANVDKKGFAYKTAPVNLNDTLDIKLRIDFGSNNGGGDGVMFVFRDTLDAPLVGSSGANLGFNASSMLTNSLGIEFDTKRNIGAGPGNGDLANDHVAIMKNGSTDHTSANNLVGPNNALPSGGNLETGTYHTVDIKWNPTTQILRVFVDCSLRASYNADIVNTIFNGDPEVHWGLLGATSGAVNFQKFCLGDDIESFIDTLPSVMNMCKGDTVDLNAGDTNVNYLWSPGLGLSASNIRNPRAYPADSTYYTVRQTYQCDTNYESVQINVIPPNFTTSAIITNAQCKNDCDGAIDLSISGGTALNGYAYEWSTTATTQDLNSLCDSMYIVTIQDTSLSSPNYLCYLLDTFFITEPTQLIATIYNPTKTKCPLSTNCDAEADGVPSGGTVPYQWNWTSSETVQQPSQLCAGWNFVTITDDQGCQSIDSVEIDVPDSIVTIGYGDTTICINSIAAIVAASSGGTPPFSYIWHENSLSGAIVSIASADAVTPVITTTYFVESYDGNGCFGDTSTVDVHVRPQLEIDFEHIDTICPYDTIDLTAIGVGGDSLYSFAWKSGNFGPTITVSPDETRYYVITLTDFCGTPYAIDSIKVQVGGYDDIRPSIRVEDDSICAGKSIYMIASGQGGYNGPEEYIFTWQHNQSNENIQFLQPVETKMYVIKIEDLCLSKPAWDSVVIYVGDTVNPKIEFTPTIACKEADVVMSMEDFDNRYTYDWIIDTIDAYHQYGYDSLLYRFSETGCYDLDLFITTDFGCQSLVSYECPIRIQGNPTAAFLHEPAGPTNIEPMLDFVNTSTGASDLMWVIDADTLFGDSAFRYQFYEREDPFEVILYARSEEGCLDTTSKFVKYNEETLIYYPNSFTPDGDDRNAEFFIISEGVQLEDFNLEIYNRLGVQVFRTNRQTQGWNGKTPNGYLVPMGTYYFVMSYRDDRNIERVVSDRINIVLTGTPNGL
jgi:gliding motility-associated-like protein